MIQHKYPQRNENIAIMLSNRIRTRRKPLICDVRGSEWENDFHRHFHTAERGAKSAYLLESEHFLDSQELCCTPPLQRLGVCAAAQEEPSL
jgi:hypothetical protein